MSEGGRREVVPHGAVSPAQELRVIGATKIMLAPFLQWYSTRPPGSVVELTGRSASGTVVDGVGGT